jgi:hypothetical protein
VLAIGILTACIVLALSALHIYWAVGGRWGSDVAVPSHAASQTALLRPSPALTLAVALALAIAAVLVLLNFYWPVPIVKLGTWGLAGVFLLRSIGEFRYTGLFKTVKDTPFARYDTAYFTPLCLALGLLCGWIAYGV